MCVWVGVGVGVGAYACVERFCFFLCRPIMRWNTMLQSRLLMPH